MPVDLLTATDSAREFLIKAGHVWATLQSSEFNQSKKQWVLVYDVGLTNPKPKKVTLDESGKMRDQYRSNAEQAIASGEFRKASELLWGSITQELKALAATYNAVISSHRDFFEFLKQLARELNDKHLYLEFVELNALHKNFYDETIPSDVFPEFYRRAIEYIEALEAMIKRPRN